MRALIAREGLLYKREKPIFTLRVRTTVKVLVQGIIDCYFSDGDETGF